jgi:GT2 family glycosyltransferase
MQLKEKRKLSDTTGELKAAPSASVIILNFNGKNFLKDCLESVLRTNYPNFEVLLVDNASTDCSLNLIDGFHSDKRLRIIRNGKNLGFSGGNNAGFEQAKNDYIVFLNNDTIVDPDWLAQLIYCMEEDTTVGLAQSLLLKTNGEEIQTAGTLLSDYLIVQRSICSDKSSNIKFPSVIEASYACGASMIIRRELINEIGLFDSRIPYYYDDKLLSVKTWIAGKRVVVVSKSKVRHFRGGNLLWKSYLTSFNYLRANICLLFDVYFDLSGLFKAGSVFVASLMIDIVLAIHSNSYAVFHADINAISWGLKNLKYIWTNRLHHWSKAKIKPATLIEKFIRIRLPTAIYLLPYRIANAHYQTKLEEIENSLRGI